MTQQYIEIEIKVQIEKGEALIKFLQQKATFVSEEHQIDTYYTPIHRNFVAQRPTDEWLRIRDSSGKYSINYKNWHHDKDGKSDFCDEYETNVGDIKQLEKIFEVLDIKKLVVVDKKRQVWKYKDYEVSIDSVKGLGEFVEIEYKGKKTTKTPAQITQEMIAFLKDLGSGEITRDHRGYPFLLLFPDEKITVKI